MGSIGLIDGSKSTFFGVLHDAVSRCCMIDVFMACAKKVDYNYLF